MLTHIPASASAEFVTASDVALATGLPRAGVVNRICDLVRRDLVLRVTRLEFRRTAAGDGAAADPLFLEGRRQATHRYRKLDTEGFPDRLWRALRMEQAATLPELLELAVRGETDPATHARDYLRVLAHHHIVTIRVLRGGRARRHYRLIRDLGPLAPVWSQRRQELYDRNAMAPISRPEGAP